MSSFNYWVGIREDTKNQISEIGTSVLVESPTLTNDTFGSHVSTSYSSTTEILWIRAINETIDVPDVGQLNREDLRIVCPYDTTVVIESRITYNGKKYIVIGIDKPDTSGYEVSHVAFAKRELT